MRRLSPVVVLALVCGAAVGWLYRDSRDKPSGSPPTMQASPNDKRTIRVNRPDSEKGRPSVTLTVRRIMPRGGSPIDFEGFPADRPFDGPKDWIIEIEGRTYFASVED